MRCFSILSAVMSMATLVACASQDTTVSDFQSALDRADRLSSQVVATNTVVTDDVLDEVLGPLMEATPPMVDLIASMSEPGADLATLQLELSSLGAAEVQLHATLERLGLQAASLADPQVSTGVPADGYIGRIVCKSAVVAAGAACVAACGGPADPICSAACTATATAGVAECNGIRNR